MAEKSIFDPASDRKYPAGGRYGVDSTERKTHIPKEIRDGEVESDEEMNTEVDLLKTDEPVFDLAEAKKAIDDEALRDARAKANDKDA